MYPETLRADAGALLEACRSRKFTLSTAESCTGGLISGLLTDIPGSSDVFDRGFVTYSNHAKIEMLWVDSLQLEKHGAVSAEIAAAMAEGAKARSSTDLALSVTGVAGPGGGTAAKPVGLVYIALALAGVPTRVERYRFEGDRNAVRMSAVKAAITLALQVVK